jgi:threonine dehydratase
MTASRLVCAACGWTPGPIDVDPYPFRCPRAGSDDGDHVILPTSDTGLRTSDDAPISRNPFIRYRSSLHSWHTARAHGLSDAEYVSLVERTDAAIERVAGCGFRVTPFCRSDSLSRALGFEGDATAGGIWVKDETGNVSGSHKARHLMGVALYLEVLRRLGIDRGADRPLAVASCGNAALAAAVVARAIDRKLLVFVPDHASASIVAQLEGLGAIVTRCARGARSLDTGRRPSDIGHRTPDFGRREDAPGDPCYLAFRRAIADGALPFSCQGNENGLVIEGCETLGYEIVRSLAAPDPSSAGQGFSLATLDRVFIQVGGGALASACVQAFAESVRAGQLAAVPRIHAVQTRGAYPLKRAYDLVVDQILARLAQSSSSTRLNFSTDDDRARHLLGAAPPALLDEAFAYARMHRSHFMWPWETEPRSVAGGILDDETYDWAVVVESMVRSSGYPVVVDEATLEEANTLARDATGIDVDHTGSAGLAGLIALTRSLDRPRPTERIAILFTGVRRSAVTSG